MAEVSEVRVGPSLCGSSLVLWIHVRRLGKVADSERRGP